MLSANFGDKSPEFETQYRFVFCQPILHVYLRKCLHLRLKKPLTHHQFKFSTQCILYIDSGKANAEIYSM